MSNKPSGSGHMGACWARVRACIESVCSIVHVYKLWTWLASYCSSVYMATYITSHFTWLKTSEGRRGKDWLNEKREHGERWEKVSRSTLCPGRDLTWLQWKRESKKIWESYRETQKESSGESRVVRCRRGQDSKVQDSTGHDSTG